MAYMPKWTYNSTERQCVSYIYGGCRKTENLFDSAENCQKTCDADYNNVTPKLLDVCSMEIDAGPCRGNKPFYAFNKNTKRCQKFFYGGRTKSTVLSSLIGNFDCGFGNFDCGYSSLEI